MKKFLSLVLALVMTMSLVTVAAGAKTFTDDSKITYIEAVDVMSTIGAIDGYSAGDFQPTTLLTRGAAAKIICNLILGPTTAGALAADKAPFKDVPANHTFAGYIAYCSAQGIINGYADKSFKPAATVTGFQFLKMLLGALGYDANSEQFVGGNWSVNVAKLAMSLKLTSGNDEFVGTKAVSREEACLYAFNTLKATMVEYDTTGSVITGGGMTITTKPSKASEVKNTATKSIKDDGLMQFAEKYFSKLVLRSGTDAFERPASVWNYKSANVGTYSKTADVSYTAAVKNGAIYTDLGLGKTVAAGNVTTYRNGASVASTALVKGGSTEIGGNGVLTEVYYDADNGTAIVVLIDTYAGKVDGIHAATSSKDAYVDINCQNDIDPDGKYETTALAVDDIVSYNYSAKTGEGIQNVAIAETVTGVLTSFTAKKSVTVGGTSYKVNASYADRMGDLSGSAKYEVTLTLDENGYAINVDTTKTSSNYAVVTKIKAADGYDSGKAQLLFTDGTTKDVVLTATSAAVGKAKDQVGTGDIVSYKTNNDDKYTLTLLADADLFNVTGGSDAVKSIVKKGESTLADFSAVGDGLNANLATAIGTGDGTSATNTYTKVASVANGKTIFLVASLSGSDTVYTAYVGIKNVPTINTAANNTTKIPVTVFAKDGAADLKTATATVVFINATAGKVTSDTKDVIFVKGATPNASYDSVKGTYYVYDAIVNGTIGKIETYNSDISADALYTAVSYDKNNIATLNATDKATATTPTAVYAAKSGVGTGTAKAANGVVGLGTGYYYSYAKDCKVFLVNTDGDISESSIGAIGTNSKDSVYFKLTDGDVSTIVVRQNKELATTYTLATDSTIKFSVDNSAWSATSAAAGTKVYVKAATAFTTLTSTTFALTKVTDATDATGAVYSFTMPAANVEAAAFTAKTNYAIGSVTATLANDKVTVIVTKAADSANFTATQKVFVDVYRVVGSTPALVASSAQTDLGTSPMTLTDVVTLPATTEGAYYVTVRLVGGNSVNSVTYAWTPKVA